MPQYDLSLPELQKYKPELEEPHDFDVFWQTTLANQIIHFPKQVEIKPVDFGLRTVKSYDVTFSGYNGAPIKGWFLHPVQVTKPLPCVIEYISYGGGRGFPADWLFWSAMGFAHFVMDSRGQGSDWRNGDTVDIPEGGNPPHHFGVMTLGISDPETYYYRRLYVDAVRAVEMVGDLPFVDPSHIALTGMSQGGSLSIATAALAPQVSAIMPEVPFLAHFRRAVTLIDSHPYNEISKYCRIHRDQEEQVFRTLSYFDIVNFAARCQKPALFSVGLMDDISPPSTVFAVYNHYAGEKQINIWSFNGHEGGATFQALDKVKFLSKIWGSAVS